jgi:hypothetical protein
MGVVITSKPVVSKGDGEEKGRLTWTVADKTGTVRTPLHPLTRLVPRT